MLPVLFAQTDEVGRQEVMLIAILLKEASKTVFQFQTYGGSEMKVISHNRHESIALTPEKRRKEKSLPIYNDLIR